MMSGAVASLLLLAAAAALAAFVILQRVQLRQVERVLEDTNGRLERLQLHFARFAPDDVVEQLTEASPGLKASRRMVTVLFADLKGFTALSDQLDPEQMLPILNGYFRAMTGPVVEHHGRVTELIGDGLLALFGALEPNPWQSPDAVLAGLAMREALQRYNESLRERSMPILEMGIGIHRGEVLAGVMGNEELSKFGVVGDAINVASRVEQLTRELGVDLLITDSVREALDEHFQLRAMPPAMVKGKSEPVVTWFVEGVSAPARPAASTQAKA
jgi:class 3 adenylate cyclase